MAIVVNQAPADICFSRNPIVYDLQANDVVETAGVAAINTISFTSAVTATTVISIRYNGQEVRFVGAAVPDASGNQIPLSATPDAGYVASLIPYFQNNYYLDPDFSVSSSGTTLILTAKKKGTAYNLLTGSYQSGTIAQTTVGVDEVRKKNHSIYVEINLVDDADNLTKIYGQPYETDTDGRAKVDISKMLHAQLQADLPPLNGDKAQKCTLSNRRYALRIAPAFGEPFNIGILTKLATKRVVLGGTPYEDGPAITPVSITQGAFSSEDLALRLGDTVRDTRTDQPQYLTFLNARATAAENLRLIAQLYFSDNTSQTVTGITTINGIGQNQTVQFATGFTDLNLSSYESPTKIVTRYTLQLTTTAGTARSAVYTYNVEREWKPYSRHFVYANSLGALETVITFGKGSETWAFVKQSAEKYLAQNYKLTDGQSLDYDLQADVKFEVASGWLRSKREVRQFADMFLSRWKFRRHNGADLPISVNTKEIKLAPDGDGRHAVGFEYQYHFSSNLLSSDTLDGEWFELIPPPFAGGGANTTWAWTVEHDNETDVPAWVLNISQQDIANWNAAFSWNNHAGAGYLLAADAALEYATNLRVDGIEERVEDIETELETFFETPDPENTHRVGATDPETGLYRLPTVAFNAQGRAVDWADGTLETIWFKQRGQLSESADLLTLFPTNTLGSVPLAAQNGVAMWWTPAIENHPNAPTGLTGYAEIQAETIDKACKVTVKNQGGEVHNYCSDISAGTRVWSGWKFAPHSTSIAEVGKLFKATAEQTISQAEIWDNGDGTFSVGQAVKFTSAVLSIAGRLAALDPLFADDLVTLRYLQYAISALVSQADFQVSYNQLLALIADRANRVHGHTIADITGLAGELDAKIAKSILTGGKAYYVLGRDANGNATMIDNKRSALNGQYLPDAVEGVYYSQTLPVELFVWPDGVFQKDVVMLSDKAWVRLGMSFDYVTGLTIAGTPPDSENPHIGVKMKWKFSTGADWHEQEFSIFLNVEPAGTSISTPTAPSSLSTTALGTNTIQLAWVDNSSNETGSKIFRGTVSGSYVLIATVGPNITTYLDSGLAENTRYYYVVQAYNTAGFAQSNEDDDLTDTSPGSTYVDEVVAGSSRIRKFGTVITPPTSANPRPNIKFGFQPARYVETREVIWQHKTTGQRRQFLQMDQNNNPSAERPDSYWTVVEVTDTEASIRRTAEAGCNLMDVWFRTPLLQTSANTYHFEIIGRLMEYAASLGVYLSIGFKQDIGNGGHPDRVGFGFDQSATWRFLLEDCAKSQQFNDETGTGTKTVYPADLTPNLFRERVHTNLLTFYTAYTNYWKNHPYKAYAPTVHPLYSNTGESHMNINEDRYMDASLTTMYAFWVYLMNTVSESKRNALFGDFLADYTNESSASARAFLRGYSGNEAKAIWQYFVQDYYFGGTTEGVAGVPHPAYFRLYAKLGAIVKAVGLRWKCDHGSFLDFSVPRQNMYALDPKFTAQYDTLKQNPMGWRVGYPEVAALKATGKSVGIEWTPGAIGPSEDFSSISQSVNTITTACMDAWDAGVDEMVLAFVVNNDYYNTVAIPIINALKAAGYWELPKQNFTPTTVFDVDLYQQLVVSSWYHNDSDGTAEYNEPIHRMTTGVTGEAGGKTRANIQKYGYRILPSNDPRL